jgi:hypothetical protein
MGTINAHTDTVTELRNARDRALATVKQLASKLRSMGESNPLACIVENDLCIAMDAHAEAENALRLALYGFEETHPHPAGRVHPGDAYAAKLRRR